MSKRRLLYLFCSICGPFLLFGNFMEAANNPVVKKKVLKNGFTVLVSESHDIPKVSMQLWFNVGSKDEKSGEKGIAHLIEHMVFKGTEKLSETDIIAITHLLSGSCNAFTWYDYTGYLFDMPEQHWRQMLPVIADCMTNCTFKDDHLNSEMKAVIQEMKLYKDNFFKELFLQMFASIFPDHPYHYPTIGYKHDLYNVRGKDLLAFYKKHYVPNNATFVVVGDVDAEEVFALVEKNFGTIPTNPHYKKETFYLMSDIASKSVILYRDVAQPIAMCGFVVPGMYEQVEHILDSLETVLADGKSSRLYKILVDELQLVTSLGTYPIRLFDHSVFFIYFEPKDVKDVDKIKSLIQDEIDDIILNGLTDQEMERAIKLSQMDYFSKLEDIEKQAYEIGLYFLATGDEQYALEYMKNFDSNLAKHIKEMLLSYFRPSVMHSGVVLPLPERDKPEWAQLQEMSDQEDVKILSTRVRESRLEQPKYTQNIEIKEPELFSFPKAEVTELSNGIKVLYYNNSKTPKINIILNLKAKYFYDPEDMQGLYNFVTAMMTEGTTHYTAVQLAQEIETRGMSLSITPGSISMSMLKPDLEKGLELLVEVLTHAIFDKKEIEKVRAQLLADVKNFWDTPLHFSSQLLKEYIYKGHPYSKNIIGIKESLEKIQQKDLQDFYKSYISPSGAILAIVGDISEYDIKDVLEKTVAKWTGPDVEAIIFPELRPVKKQEVNYYINRDQTVLCLANLSIDRMDKDYDKLRLFDEVFGGGSHGSMSSRLFQLREQTGLFYAILGSLTINSGKQPGVVLVKTIVSNDKLAEAERMIKETINSTLSSISEYEFAEAKRTIANALMDNFESNSKIAQSFLFLEKYDLPADYFDNHAKQLSDLTIDQVTEAAKKVLNADDLLILRVGRVR